MERGSAFKPRMEDKFDTGTTGPPSAAGRNRARTAASVFVVGFVLLLWAWGSWIYRTAVTGSGLAATRMDSSEQPVDPTEVVRTFPLFLLVGLLLVFAFLVGSYVLVRTSRRYRTRRWLKCTSSDGGSTPTPMDDVWAMHKLPEGTDLDETNPSSREC